MSLMLLVGQQSVVARSRRQRLPSSDGAYRIPFAIEFAKKRLFGFGGKRLTRRPQEATKFLLFSLLSVLVTEN